MSFYVSSQGVKRLRRLRQIEKDEVRKKEKKKKERKRERKREKKKERKKRLERMLVERILHLIHGS